MTDAAFARIVDAAARVAEHCDSVVILTTKDEHGITSARACVKGNLFAARESARRWLAAQDARDAEAARRDLAEADEEDD